MPVYVKFHSLLQKNNLNSLLQTSNPQTWEPILWLEWSTPGSLNYSRWRVTFFITKFSLATKRQVNLFERGKSHLQMTNWHNGNAERHQTAWCLEAPFRRASCRVQGNAPALPWNPRSLNTLAKHCVAEIYTYISVNLIWGTAHWFRCTVFSYYFLFSNYCQFYQDRWGYPWPRYWFWTITPSKLSWLNLDLDKNCTTLLVQPGVGCAHAVSPAGAGTSGRNPWTVLSFMK